MSGSNLLFGAPKAKKISEQILASAEVLSAPAKVDDVVAKAWKAPSVYKERFKGFFGAFAVFLFFQAAILLSQFLILFILFSLAGSIAGLIAHTIVFSGTKPLRQNSRAFRYTGNVGLALGFAIFFGLSVPHMVNTYGHILDQEAAETKKADSDYARKLTHSVESQRVIIAGTCSPANAQAFVAEATGYIQNRSDVSTGTAEEKIGRAYSSQIGACVK